MTANIDSHIDAEDFVKIAYEGRECVAVRIGYISAKGKDPAEDDDCIRVVGDAALFEYMDMMNKLDRRPNIARYVREDKENGKKTVELYVPRHDMEALAVHKDVARIDKSVLESVLSEPRAA